MQENEFQKKVFRLKKVLNTLMIDDLFAIFLSLVLNISVYLSGPPGEAGKRGKKGDFGGKGDKGESVSAAV